MSLRYILLIILVLYVVFEFFIPIMQGAFGYTLGTLIAIVVVWLFLSNQRAL